MADFTNYILYVDIGNSRIKISGGTETASFEYNDNLEALIKIFIHKTVGIPEYIAYSTVNHHNLELFLNSLPADFAFELIDIGSLLQEQKQVKFDNIQGIGNDRIIGLIGAMKFSEPPLITADCGTAITINVLDENGVCKGGSISAGVYTQLGSLAGNTEKLKGFEIKSPSGVIGSDTSEALNSGIILGIAGGIKEIVIKVRKDILSGQEAKLILTGGAADIVASGLKSLDFEFTHIPNLVIEGIKTLMNGYLYK